MLTSDDYARAESYLPWHVRKRLYATSVRPHWTGDGDELWYAVDTRDGRRYVRVDPAAGTRVESDGPFDGLPKVDDNGALEVDRRADLPSPTGSKAAFVRDHDLWIRDNATGTEKRLTDDGRPGYDYATPVPNPLVAAGLSEPTTTGEPKTAGIWSPDGRRLLTHRMDARATGQLTLVQAAPPDGARRPKAFTYAYPLPGDDPVPTAELVLFDVETGERIDVDVPPLNQLYYGTPLPDENGAEPGHGRSIWWSDDGSRCYLLRRGRGFRTLTLYEIDATTGSSRVLVEETDGTPVDPNITVGGPPNVRVLAGSTEVLWYSHRDGWGHLYLYSDLADESEPMVRPVTSGEWAVVDVLHVDEKGRSLLATAVGREAGRDRYARSLYRIPLDGGEPVLLTPEAGDHLVSVSPSGRWIVTTRSTIDTPPVTELRDADGVVVRTLETADLSELTGCGWTYPERFTVLARDGETEISGVLIRPSTFDPARRYPVVDSIYGGPQTNQAPVSFAEVGQAGNGFWQAQAIAELGFVVVMIDGLGMPYRSKAFRDVAYGNLADAGLPDHIAALRQLAETRPYLNLDLVGIYGHSAGGYASCRAMFAHPDFYRVGVSSAGNHDHRLDKAWWIERYMGLPVGERYAEQANPAHAGSLRGRLLLAHGEMDENVHVSSTLAVVNALIEANQDFDLLILPNRTHAFGSDPYFVRRRWDYFVRHLSGAEPPQYAITGA